MIVINTIKSVEYWIDNADVHKGNTVIQYYQTII